MTACSSKRWVGWFSVEPVGCSSCLGWLEVQEAAAGKDNGMLIKAVGRMFLG